MSISLCLIVRNEEKNLDRCLSSFKGIADELIIVDTGSTDRTKMIARQFGALVFDYEWSDDFSAARNYAISKAGNKWVMMVDADDVISEQSIDMIRQNLKQDVDVIFLPYVYSQREGNSGHTAWLPRIWKKSLGLQYQCPVHEYLDVSGGSAEKFSQVNAPVIHMKAIDCFRKSFERNIRIMNRYIKKYPDDLRALYYLVHDNKHLGDYKAAIKWSEKFLEQNSNDRIKNNKVLVLKGLSHMRLGEAALARKSFESAIDENAALIEPYLQLGDYYYKKKEIEKAIHMYTLAKRCRFPEESYVFFHQSAYDYYAHKKLCYTLPLLGRYKEALAYAQRVLRFTPRDKKLTKHIDQLRCLI